MILNEITVDLALSLTKDNFDMVQSKIEDVKDIIIGQLFPEDRSTITAEINWSEISKS